MAITLEEAQKIAGLAKSALERVNELVSQFHEEFPEFRLTDSSGDRLQLGLVGAQRRTTRWLFTIVRQEGRPTTYELSPTRIMLEDTYMEADARDVLAKMAERIP